MHARVRTPEACVNWLVNEKACAGHARHDVVSCGRGAESVSTQYYHSNVQLFEMHHEKQRSCGSASVVLPPVSRKCPPKVFGLACPESVGSRKTLDGTGRGAHGSPTNQFPSSANAPNQPGPPGPPCSLQDRKRKLHECATTKQVRTLPNEQRRFLRVTISTRLKPCVQMVVSFRPVLRGHCIVPTIAVGDSVVDDRTGVSGLHRPACSDQLRD